jgi:hypothetical protein
MSDFFREDIYKNNNKRETARVVYEKRSTVHPNGDEYSVSKADVG